MVRKHSSLQHVVKNCSSLVNCKFKGKASDVLNIEQFQKITNILNDSSRRLFKSKKISTELLKRKSKKM